MINSSNNKRIAKNTIFLYIRMIFVLFVSIYTTKVVLRVLGVEDFGIYNVVCGFVSLFSILNTCLTTGTNRFYNCAIGQKDDKQERDVYNASVRIQIIIVICAILLLESFGMWYLNNKMVIPLARLDTAIWIFHFSMFSLCMLIMEIPYSAAIIAHEKMDFYAFVSILDVFLKLVIVFILQYADYDKLSLYGFLIAIISLLNFSIYFFYTIRMFSHIRISRHLNTTIFKSLLSFSIWSLLDPITVSCRGQGSNMVLNAFFGPVVNAAYGISTQISSAIDGFTNNLSIAFRPQIIQSYSAGEYNRTKMLFYSMSRINYMLHLMLIVPITMSLTYILDLWLGNYPVETRIFATCVMLMQTINCLHAPISTVMVATGNIKKIKIVSLIIIGSVIPLSIVGFKIGLSVYSIYYMLLVLSVLNVIASVLILREAFPVITIYDYLKIVITPLSTFTFIVISIPLLIFFKMEESLTTLLFQCFLTFILAIFSAYFFVFNNKEKDLFKKILINKFKK